MGQGSERQPSGKGAERVGRYRLLDKLFDGALGELWLGQSADDAAEPASVWVRRVRLGREVGDDAARGLVEAAREAQKVEHEGLHPVLDVIRTETEIAIVSAAVEGETLRAILWRAGIKRQPIPASIALRVGLDLIAATAALRRAKTPTGRLTAGIGADNVVLTVEGRPLLFEPIVSGFAATQEPWGKDPKLACYRAPETLKESSTTVDERADVFSAAVLLWEMLRNRPLFGGAKFEAVERSIVQGSVGRVDSLRPPGAEAIAKALADTVGRALERDPIARPRSLEVLAKEIEQTAQSVARRDGVAAFVETAAADSLARQRALSGEPVPPSEAATLEVDVPLFEPERARRPDEAAPGAASGGASPAGAEGAGVPNFGELFGAPAAAETGGARAAAARGRAKEQEAEGGEEEASLLEAGAEPPSEKPKPGALAQGQPRSASSDAPSEPDESDPVAGEPRAGASEDAAAEAAGEPEGAAAPASSGATGGGRIGLFAAAAAAAAIAIWFWAPWAGPEPVDSAAAASSPAAATEAPPASAPAAVPTEAVDGAAAEPAADAGDDAGGDASAEGAVEPTATASAASGSEEPAPKPTGKKPSGGSKPKGRYMPGTL